MAEKWELGGFVIEKDGEKMAELHGIKVVHGKPVRAIVYHKFTDLEGFLYDFIKKVEDEMAARIGEERVQSPFQQPPPQPQGLFPLQLQEQQFPWQLPPPGEVIVLQQPSQPRDELKEREKLIRVKVDKALRHLLPGDLQFSLMPSAPLDHVEQMAVRMIIASSFEFDISTHDYYNVYVPVFSRKEVEGSGSSISLPDDVLKGEIFPKLTSLHASTMVKMVGKSVRPRKYEYENLVDVIPGQALAVLSKLYGEQKDPSYKEYLFSLMMKAWSVYPFQSNFLKPQCVNNPDFLTTLFSFAIQVTSTSARRMLVSNLLVNRIDITRQFIDLGVLDLKDLPISNYTYDMTSIPDDYFDIVDQWFDVMRKSPVANLIMPMIVGFPDLIAMASDTSPKDAIVLYKDLKNGKFSSFYDCRLMADVIRKGYIKETSRATEMDKYYIFLESLELGTQEDRDLILKFIEPNPFTDFFLGGVKCKFEAIMDMSHSLEAELFVLDCVHHGMDFVDQEKASGEFSSFEDREVLDGDSKITINLEDVLTLKDLGNDRFLVFEKAPILQPVVIRKFGHLFVKTFTGQRQTSFIEYLANATDEQIRLIISFCMKTDVDIEIGGIIEDSITDLELYRRYVINAQTIQRYVYEDRGEEKEGAKEAEEEEG